MKQNIMWQQECYKHKFICIDPRKELRDAKSKGNPLTLIDYDEIATIS